MRPTPSIGSRRRRVALVLLAGACACARADAPIVTREPPHRPPDGLLDDGTLQSVVEAQLRRDAATLVGDLSSARAAVRARAAFALGSVQAPEAIPALIGLLGDSAAAVRRDAAFALGQVAAADAVGPLAEAFAREGDPTVRARVLEALGKLPTEASAAALIAQEVPGDLEPTRTLALGVLAAVRRVSTPEARAYLLGKLDDPDPRERMAAAYWIGRLRAPEEWSAGAALVRAALDGYEKDDPAAMYLVQGLGRLHDPFDADRLRDWAATAREWRIRANAVTALTGGDGNPDTRAVLLEALDDPSTHVAVNAARALAGGEPGADELRRVERWIEAHPQRWQVVEPLLVLAARADAQAWIFGWIDALAPSDSVRRGIGLRALGHLAGVAARERLARAATSDSGRQASEAVAALASRWSVDRADSASYDLYFGVMSRAIRSRSVAAVYSAAPVLADSVFTGAGNVDTLAAAWRSLSAPRDLEAMAAVLRALGRTGTPAAAEVLREALSHPHPSIRRAAAAALSSLTGEEVEALRGSSGSADTTTPSASPDPGRLDWSYLAGLGAAPRLVLQTERGRVVVRLDTEEAPHTVQTITRLAEEGRYDGVPFHRVVPNFVVQGGDFASGDGFGGPGFTITSEFTLIPYLRGVVGMASAGKDTEGSQFFITHSMQPHLDGGYTSFGWVVQGMDVVDRLQVGDRIVRATVERRD